MVVAVGVGVYWSGGTSPSSVIAQMWDSIYETNSATYNVDLKIKDLRGGALASMVITASGDTSDADNIKSKASFTFNSNPASGFPLSLALDFVLSGGSSYVKADLSGAASLLKTFGYESILALNKLWIKLGLEDLQQFGAYKTQYTEEQKEQVQQALKNSDIIKVTEVLADEEISGVDVYHYKFSIETESLSKFLVEITQTAQSRAFTAKEIAALKASIDKGFAVMPAIGGEIWIGKSDKLLYKITLSLAGATVPVVVDLVVIFKDYNAPVSVSVPSSYISLEEAMAIALSGLE